MMRMRKQQEGLRKRESLGVAWGWPGGGRGVAGGWPGGGLGVAWGWPGGKGGVGEERREGERGRDHVATFLAAYCNTNVLSPFSGTSKQPLH